MCDPVSKKKWRNIHIQSTLTKIHIKPQHDAATSEVAFPLRKGSYMAFAQSKQPGVAGRPSFFTFALNTSSGNSQLLS